MRCIKYEQTLACHTLKPLLIPFLSYKCNQMKKVTDFSFFVLQCIIIWIHDGETRFLFDWLTGLFKVPRPSLKHSLPDYSQVPTYIRYFVISR
jgi:hypothetical protein